MHVYGPMMAIRVTRLLSAVSLFLAVGVLHAQTVWDGSTSTNWFTNSNWSANHIPASLLDVAEIDTNSGNQPTLTSSVTISGLIVGADSSSGANTLLTINGALTANSTVIGQSAGSTGAILVSGAGSRLTGNTSHQTAYIIGDSGNGTLTAANRGNLTSRTAIIGNNTGSSGTVLVTDTNSFWNLGTFALSVGNLGTGNLTVANGANVTSGMGNIGIGAGANGSVTITGTHSFWSTSGNIINVGYNGTGSLSVTNGGNVTSANGIVGNQTGSSGSATVDGTGSKWMLSSVNQGGFLVVGASGNGTLSITNGGNVTSGPGTIAGSAGTSGSVVVDGAGSKWSVANFSFNGNLDVGEAGTGSLSITNGGNVNAAQINIGAQSGSNGTLTVIGPNSTLGASSITIGASGTASLTIGNGAIVSGNLFTVGSLGTVTQTGGMLKLTSSLLNTGFKLNSGSVYNLQGGILEASNFTSSHGTLNLGGGEILLNGTTPFNQTTFGINATLVNGTTSTIVANGTSTSSLSGVINGGGNIQFSGNGAESLSANNTYTGATIINGGNLNAGTIANGGAVSSIGASTSDAANLVINGGALTVGSISTFPFTPITTDRLFTIGPSGATIATSIYAFSGLAFTNTGALAFSGTSGTASSLSFAGQFSTVTFAPQIGDNGPGGTTSVFVAEFSNLTLTNANTYSGNTTVSNGTLLVNNVTGSATGSGTVVINGVKSGALQIGYLGGNGTIAGNVLLNNGAALVPGNNHTGTLTVGGLTVAINTELTFYFNNAPSNTQVNVTNADSLIINGGQLDLLNSTDNSPLTALGNYTLFNYSGSIGGTGLGAFSVNNPQPGLNYNFLGNGTAVQLNLANIALANSWSASGDGAWGTGANWSALAAPDGAGSIIGFANAAAPTNVAVDAGHTVGDLVFNSASGDFTLNSTGGSTLTFDNGSKSARVDVMAGNATINAPLALTGNGLMALVATNSTLTLSGVIGESATATLTKGGNGMLTLSGHNTYSGGTVLNYGTLNLAATDALGNGLLTINGGNLTSTLGSTLTLGPANPITVNNSFGYLGANDLVLNDTTLVLGSSVQTASGTSSTLFTLNVSTANLIINSMIQGGNALIKEGGGGLVLNGNSTSAIGLTLNNGTLTVNGAYGGVTVNNSTATVNGNITGMTVNNGALVLSGHDQAISGDSLGYSNGTTAPILTVQAGGTITDSFFTINGASAGQSSLTITGSGSSLINTVFLNTNGSGLVAMTVTNGGLISSPFYWLIGSTTATFNLLSGGTMQFTSSQGIKLQGGSLVLNLAGGTLKSATTGLNITVNGTLADGTTTTIDTGGNQTTYSGILSGTGSLAKTGNGNLTLTGNNTYTGTTTVTNGTLALSGNGNISASSGLALSLRNLASYAKVASDGTFTYAGNLTLNLGNGLNNGIYNLFNFTNETGDFLSVSLSGLFANALVDNSGIWNGTTANETLSFNETTGQLAVAAIFPPGTSATKQSWLQNNFTIAQLADANIYGDSVNPYGDGVPNLLKYAFGLNAWADGHPGLPQPTVVGGNLTMVFTAPPSDIAYSVEASSDLINWSTSGVTVQTNGGQVTATYPLPASGQVFLHVVVSPAP